MRVVINPDYAYLREWIEALPQTFEQQGTIIYNARNQIRVIDLTAENFKDKNFSEKTLQEKKLTEKNFPEKDLKKDENCTISRTTALGTLPNDGLLVNVKRYCVPRPFNRVVYSFLRQPKAQRAYQNAWRLQQMGIATPTPIAYLLCGQGLLSESYLVTVQVPASRQFYEFRNRPLRGYESIVRQFARFTARVHELGVLHLDYSPGNILFRVDADGQAQFVLVDINRMQFRNAPIGQKDACKNFCRLWGEQDFFELLADEYATARGWDKATTRTLIIHYWKQFWKYRK